MFYGLIIKLLQRKRILMPSVIRQSFCRLPAVLFLFLVYLPAMSYQALAHEFWIDPVSWQIKEDEKLVAYLRTGQRFSGFSNVYIPADFSRFSLVGATGEENVKGRLGDNPALDSTTALNGLVAIVHETTDSIVNYVGMQQFASFASEKGYPDAARRHLERGLSRSAFRERYRRHARALVAIGHSDGSDRPSGMEWELVAMLNPYTLPSGAMLPIRLLHDGRPVADHQVTIFSRNPNGKKKEWQVKTDGDGIVRFQPDAGHDYLLDAVLLRELNPASSADDAVWESRWASLTFHIP